VVGDWEVEFDKRFEINLDGEPATGMTTITCYEAEIKTFITNLLAAKDREREGAVAKERKKVVGEIIHKLWTAKSYYSIVGGDERNIGRNLMADDLISSLTPLTK